MDLARLGHNSRAYVHAVTEAIKLTMADRERYIGDPAFVDVPLDALLSASYLDARLGVIDPEHAWPDLPPPGNPLSGHVHFGRAISSPCRSSASRS